MATNVGEVKVTFSALKNSRPERPRVSKEVFEFVIAASAVVKALGIDSEWCNLLTTRGDTRVVFLNFRLNLLPVEDQEFDKAYKAELYFLMSKAREFIESYYGQTLEGDDTTTCWDLRTHQTGGRLYEAMGFLRDKMKHRLDEYNKELSRYSLGEGFKVNLIPNTQVGFFGPSPLSPFVKGESA